MISRTQTLILLCLVCFSSVFTAPPSTTLPPSTASEASLVAVSSESPKEVLTDNDETKNDTAPVLPKIYEMKVDTNVSNRFATTLIVSKVKNLDKNAQQATFAVVLPEKAYISGFVMEIDGKSYEAYVKEKEEAKKTYDEAVASGQAAAHVAVNARDSNRFTVSVNVEPQSKAIFRLTYEELLERQNEQYEVVLNIHPGQPVNNLNVEVHINESRPLKFVKAPSLRSGNEISKNDEKLDPHADIEIINKTSAEVKFSPDIERQKQLATGLGTKEENGLAGQFVVQYDVERDPQGGEVLVDEGFFVHFFAPSELPALPKHVVFVLDTSGSMDGTRIVQLKEAMNSILSELKKEDIFNIIEFGSTVKVWNVDKVEIQYEHGENPWADPEEKVNRTGQVLPEAISANEENVKKAIEVVKKLNAFGGTDIQSALKIGLEIVQKNKKVEGGKNKHQPLIMFLTDGEPTVGEFNTEKITSTISELNNKQCPIFSLSFGDGADRDFLQKISLKNLGFARHIYEGADASLQLQEFYKQISSPLLSNVTFKYVSNVTEVTKSVFPILFSGSEIVVSGIIDPGFSPPIVKGWGIDGPIDFVPVVERSVGKLERLWAYLTLKQVLEQRDAAENKTGPTQEALRIALKYSFVTDVSSLVVVKPNDTSAVNTEDASKNPYYLDTADRIAGGGFSGSAGLAIPLSGGSAYASAAFAPAFNYPVNKVGSAMYLTTTFRPIAPIFAPPPIALEDPQPSLPPVPIVPTPTTNTTTLPTHQKATSVILNTIPGLSEAIHENGTITLPSGDNFDLGLNETITDLPECDNSLLKAKGVCTLLLDCPEAATLLTDVKVYENHFCKLQKFAGVCCPPRATKTD